MAERTALVTGGTGGLGTSVVARLAQEGWRVVVPTNRDPATVTLDVPAELLHADMTTPEGARAAVAAATADAGAPLRGVALLVGGFAAGPTVAETPLGEYERMLQLNLRPAILAIQAAVPALIQAGGGAIVTVSSTAALNPFRGASAYATSKAALIAFTRTVAIDHHADGIRANAVVPGTIDTAANRRDIPADQHASFTPPAHVAAVIAHLLSDASAATTGAAIPVSGRP